MAIFVQTNVQVIINGTDLSDHTVKVTLKDMRAKVDLTAMGATNIVYGKGLGDAEASIDFLQDFAASKVHAVLQPLISGTTPFAVEVRPTLAARSATNPAWLMSALLFEYPMLDGKVGDAAIQTFVFSNGSQSGVTYPIS